MSEAPLLAPVDRAVILVVEDDMVQARLYQQLLAREAWQVVIASSLAEADTALAAHRVSLILLDLFLPDGDSRSWLTRVRATAAHKATPVIVAAATAVVEAQIDFYALGAGPVLEKPVRPAMLVAAVGGALRRTSAAGADGVTPAETPTPTRAPSHRILVVEDDDVTAALVEHRLGREGHLVDRVATAPEALAIAGGAELSLIILDIMLPGFDGFELLSRLRAMPRNARVPIIMLTGLGNERDVERALSLGANDYMLKPFSPVELVARVNRLLRQA